MKRNFPDLIEAYLDYTKGQESSQRINLWSFISIIAGALERRVYIQHGRDPMYPNLYIFIVGASGLIKKSTTTGAAVSLLRDLPNIKIMADRVTATSMLEQLSASKKRIENDENSFDQTAMFLYASELIVLVKEVFGDVVNILTTLYDSPKVWEYKTRHHGSYKCPNACLNLLAATTIGWLKEGITDRVMSAGFAGRVLFVCEKELPKPVPWPPIPDGILREKIAEDLLDIYSMMGEMKPTEDFMQAYNEWYLAFDQIKRGNTDDRLNGYYGRKATHLLKLSMVRSATKGSSFQMTKEDFEWAVTHVDNLESDLMDLYETPRKEGNNFRFKVYDFIHSRQKVSLLDLIREFRPTASIQFIHHILKDLTDKKEVLAVAEKNTVFYLFNEESNHPWRPGKA